MKKKQKHQRRSGKQNSQGDWAKSGKTADDPKTGSRRDRKPLRGSVPSKGDEGKGKPIINPTRNRFSDGKKKHDLESRPRIDRPLQREFKRGSDPLARKHGSEPDQKVKASVDKNARGFGFLIFEDRRYEDGFLPPNLASRFFHGDRVEVSFNKRGEVLNIEVVQHRFRELVGKFLPSEKPGVFRGPGSRSASGPSPITPVGAGSPREPRGGGDGRNSRASQPIQRIRPEAALIQKRLKEAKQVHETDGARGTHAQPQSGRGHNCGWIVFERKKTKEQVWVPTSSIALKAGDWVRAKLHFHEEGDFSVTAEVVENFGELLPASIDVTMIANEYGLVEEHPAAAVKEAESFTLDLSEVEHGLRKDFRNLPFFTIDGETARDFDDAVTVEPHPKGFKLWVAIADVSTYVTKGTALDKDAHSRGTSVYFPERAFHMLPGALSEGLCSLKPKVPRLALVAEMIFDKEGNRISTVMHEAVIESKRRATYTEISNEIDDWRNNRASDPKWELAPHVALYLILKKARHFRGSLDFDLPEAEVWVDKEGNPTKIFRRPRLDAHRLIEEFMIAANEGATDWAVKNGLPFLFRVHEEPSNQALQQFQELARTAGVSVAIGSSNLPEVLSDLIRRLDGHPAQTTLNLALLRSMRQAIYSAEPGRHFGLASPGYTHFTSPIRRYPDLIVHRVIRMCIRKQHFNRDTLTKELTEIAEHCSYRERIASDADREAIRLKQVRIMIQHVGSDFVGKVVGVLESGFFVALDEPYVEGMVPVDSMNDDTYVWRENEMALVGKRTRKRFEIGTEVKVRVAKASIEQRRIDFVLSASVDGADDEAEPTEDKPASTPAKNSANKPQKGRRKR